MDEIEPVTLVRVLCAIGISACGREPAPAKGASDDHEKQCNGGAIGSDIL